MKVAPRRHKLHFSDLLYIYIYAYMPNVYIYIYIYMLQLNEILPSVTNGPNQIHLTFKINILQDLQGQF